VVLEQVGQALADQRAARDPGLDLLEVDLDVLLLQQRIVRAEDLVRLAFAVRAAVDRHDAEVGAVQATEAGQADTDSHGARS
jgi:hypothetical protein